MVSLLKHSGISLSDFRDLPRDEEEGEDTEEFNFDEPDSPFDKDVSRSESSIICYVAGYIGHSICKKLTCAACEQLFITGRVLPEVETSEESAFLGMMTRGGLKSPSDALFLFCKCVYSVFLCIQSSAQWYDFLRLRKPGIVLSSVSLRLIENSSYSHLQHHECANGHLFKDHLSRCARSLFNVLAKNFVKTFPKQNKKTCDEAKVRKLRSTK